MASIVYECLKKYDLQSKLRYCASVHEVEEAKKRKLQSKSSSCSSDYNFEQSTPQNDDSMFTSLYKDVKKSEAKLIQKIDILEQQKLEQDEEIATLKEIVHDLAERHSSCGSIQRETATQFPNEVRVSVKGKFSLFLKSL
jgi:hypothetical protein